MKNDSVITEANSVQKYYVGANNEIQKNIYFIKSICKLVDKYSLEFNFEIKHNKSKELINHLFERLGHDKRSAINPSKIFGELSIYFEEDLKKKLLNGI